MRVQDIAGFEGRLAKVEGPARSGKTQACALRCKRLLEGGADPGQILVVVSTGAAKRAFRARLARLMGDAGGELRQAAGSIRVARAVEVCEEVMDDERVVALTGRRARVLNDAEYTFFLEDLKTLGQKNQRLHNMLLFFFAQWSNLCPEQEWLLPGEESDLLAYARRVLASLGATLRHELPYLCAEFLASEAGEAFGQRWAHVLCDDFQNLSRAEQACMALLARDQLIVFGCAGKASKANTDYPCPEGFERFERVRKGAEVFELKEQAGPAGALAFERALGAADGACAGAAGAAAEGAGAAFVEWGTPEEELEGICRLADAWMACSPERRAGDVAVAVPTRRWGAFVEKALAAHGIRAHTAGLGRKLGGDPRTCGMHALADAWVGLRLLCDGRDPLAWRAWTGFDNAITNSEAWTHIYKLSWESGRGVCEVLDEVAGGNCGQVPKAELIARRLQDGKALAAQAAGLRGHALAHAVGLDATPAASCLDGQGLEQAGPRELLCALRGWLEGADAPAHGAVGVTLFENLCGQDFPLVVMAGMVDGMAPGKDVFDIGKTDKARAQALADDRVRARVAAGSAGQALVVSTFTHTSVEVAERSKMQVARIAAAPGGRVARVSPSQLLAEAGIAPKPAAEAGLDALLA